MHDRLHDAVRWEQILRPMYDVQSTYSHLIRGSPGDKRNFSPLFFSFLFLCPPFFVMFPGWHMSSGLLHVEVPQRRNLSEGFVTQVYSL